MAVLVSRVTGKGNTPVFTIELSGEELNTIGYVIHEERSKLYRHQCTKSYFNTIKSLNSFYFTIGSGENW